MIIQTDRELIALCTRIQQVSVIFLDTEFVGEGHYYPELGTIQLAAGDEVVLIDPLAVRDLTPFLELLTNPAIEKVFHAAGQDLSIFSRLLGGRAVAPVFDTQVAAALLGYEEQVSFLNLVERVTGTRLLKSHSFTDWLRRPLTDGQVEYALDDVRYLIPAYEALVRELHSRERLDWAREEFARMEDPSRYAPADPTELYLRLRGVERMNGHPLALLRDLVAWREELARNMDIPTGRIARDEVLMELARRPRTSVKELRDIRGIQPQQIDRYGAQMIGVTVDGTSLPPISCKRPPSLPTSLEPTVDFMTLCVRSLASENALAPGMVATRSDLTALVMSGEQADIPVMRGWRRAVIGDALLATLQGQATARIIPGSRQVHLEWHAPTHLTP